MSFMSFARITTVGMDRDVKLTGTVVLDTVTRSLTVRLKMSRVQDLSVSTSIVPRNYVTVAHKIHFDFSLNDVNYFLPP